MTSKMNKIAGRTVFIDRAGVEVSKGAATTETLLTGEVRERVNGPHYDAKWARDLLGTPTQAEVRRDRLAKQAETI
jgi:hypothetical protein